MNFIYFFFSNVAIRKFLIAYEASICGLLYSAGLEGMVFRLRGKFCLIYTHSCTSVLAHLLYTGSKYRA